MPRSTHSAWRTLTGTVCSIQPCTRTRHRVNSYILWQSFIILDSCACGSHHNHVPDAAVGFVSSSQVLQGALDKVLRRHIHHVGFRIICQSSGDPKWSNCLRRQKRHVWQVLKKKEIVLVNRFLFDLRALEVQ